jgi:hypothetical protein
VDVGVLMVAVTVFWDVTQGSEEWLLYLEDGGNRFLRNVDTCLTELCDVTYREKDYTEAMERSHTGGGHDGAQGFPS